MEQSKDCDKFLHFSSVSDDWEKSRFELLHCNPPLPSHSGMSGLIHFNFSFPSNPTNFFSVSFFYFPGVVVVVLLFYDGWLLPLSFSKLAKTSESRCCHSVSQTVRNSWSRAVTVDFSVGPSEPAASAHPCKANYPIYFRSLIHSIYIPPLPSSVPS